MNTMTKCLFGGALMGAGLCSNATASEITWGNTVQAGAFAPYGMWDTHSGAGDFTVSNSSYFGFAHAIADSSGVSLVAQAEFLDSFNARGGNSNVAAAFVDSQFSLSQNASVTISWNFRDTVGSNLTIAGFSAMGSSGSIDLNLLENVTYDIIAQVSSIDSILLPLSGNETYITMTVNVVPLPTAAFAGLGMLAGLGAIRRSRK